MLEDSEIEIGEENIPVQTDKIDLINNMLTQTHILDEKKECDLHKGQEKQLICVQRLCSKKLTPLCQLCKKDQNHKNHKLVEISDLKSLLSSHFNQRVQSLNLLKKETLEKNQKNKALVIEIQTVLKNFIKQQNEFKSISERVDDKIKTTSQLLSSLESMSIEEIVNTVFKSGTLEVETKIFDNLYQAESDIKQFNQDQQNLLEKLTQTSKSLSEILIPDLIILNSNSKIDNFNQFQNELRKDMNKLKQSIFDGGWILKTGEDEIEFDMTLEFLLINKNEIDDLVIIQENSSQNQSNQVVQIVRQCQNIQTLFLGYEFPDLKQLDLDFQKKQISLSELVINLDLPLLHTLALEIFPSQEKQILQVLKKYTNLADITLFIQIAANQRLSSFIIKLLRQMSELKDLKHITIHPLKFIHIFEKNPSLEIIQQVQRILNKNSTKIQTFRLTGGVYSKVINPHLYLFDSCIYTQLKDFMFKMTNSKHHSQFFSQRAMDNNIISNTPLLQSIDLGEIKISERLKKKISIPTKFAKVLAVLRFYLPFRKEIIQEILFDQLQVQNKIWCKL